VALGEEQIRYFSECLDEAIAKDRAADVPAYVFGVTNYYPSGTKQQPGSLVDHMVEQARDIALKGLERQEMLMRIKETSKPAAEVKVTGRPSPPQ